MRIRIEPSRLFGNVMAPPSKSYAQRLLIAAALARGKSTISGISESEDMGAALDCIRVLGASFEKKGDTVCITGAGDALRGDGSAPISGLEGALDDDACKGEGFEAVFLCRESGNTLRFLIPVSLCFFDRVCFKGSRRLMERGISVYEELFSQRGISIEKGEDFIRLEGVLSSGEYEARGDVSSQFITGLLFALPLLKGDSTLKLIPPVESRPYIDITLDVLKSFGIEIREEGENAFFIKGGQAFCEKDMAAEGDWSNAAFLYALNSIGHELRISGLNMESIQGDRGCLRLFEELSKEAPCIDISGCPDLGPVLFSLASAKNGALITGTKRLKIKESDRASAMASELSKFGGRLEIMENSVRVMKADLRRPSEPLCSHNDHRIVMALSVLLSLTGGEIEGAEAVRKTWPDFFDVMKKLGMKVFLA